MSRFIRIAGIRAEGRHGVSPGERDRPQPFVVDVEVRIEAGGDDLARTADYRAAVSAVRRVVEVESYGLIETMAERIAALVAALPGVLGARVLVHKPGAAARLGVADVVAEATAEPEAPEAGA